MLPQNIIDILLKYKIEVAEEITNINLATEKISSELNSVNTTLIDKLASFGKNTGIENKTKEQELLSDSFVLREFISNIEPINNSSSDANDNTESAIVEFDKKVFPYLLSDDICPFCNVKLVPHTIYYKRIVDSQPKDEMVEWHRCPCCKKMFALDYEIENFDFEDTNIFLNKDEYECIPNIDIYSIIVLSNTLKCSSKHKTKDLVAKLPILNEHGEISYLKINASYCFNCKRFTILKDDFNSIKDVIMCKIIDETTEYMSNNNNDELDLSKQSILFQYGYNVQTKKNLSEKQRHIILSSIIEANIMQRRDVINHINTLIDRGSKIPSWKTATQKWKDDKQFVAEYQRDSLPEVVFNKIILKHKRI